MSKKPIDAMNDFLRDAGVEVHEQDLEDYERDHRMALLDDIRVIIKVCDHVSPCPTLGQNFLRAALHDMEKMFK